MTFTGMLVTLPSSATRICASFASASISSRWSAGGAASQRAYYEVCTQPKVFELVEALLMSVSHRG